MDQNKIAALVDRQDIVDTIYRLARGLDRCDAALLRSCFHEGASIDVGMFAGPAMQFVDWVIPVLTNSNAALGSMQRTQHIICNVLVQVSGDTARSESYFVAQHVIQDPAGQKNMLAAGRYLDQFERRAQEWRMTHRQSVYEWNRVDDATSTWEEAPSAAGLLRGLRGAQDKSYEYLKFNNS